MKYSIIHLNPDRLDLPLTPLYAGKLSSAVWLVEGAPDDIASLAVDVEYMDGGEKMCYTAAGTRQADGMFRVYLAPAYFPDVSQSLEYHVLGNDTNENPRWLGTGQLGIIDNPADGSPIAPDILPRNSYAYNPQTGLYYKIIAEVNDLGQITLSTEQEGVAL